jgi:hypothetical protein
MPPLQPICVAVKGNENGSSSEALQFSRKRNRGPTQHVQNA